MKKTDNQLKIKEEIVKIVKEAGIIILEAHNDKETIFDKEGYANFVTKYDKQVQRFLVERFQQLLPDASYLAEEDGLQQSIEKGYCFIIDPIDGTTNFIQEYMHSCISVGLSYEGEMVVGVVYNPYRDEMFSAVKGVGAYKDGKQIHAGEATLGDSLVAFGCARYNSDDTENVFALSKAMYVESRGLRNRGSSTLDICDIACGRNGIYFELLLQPWDYAAASLILEEAGGVITKIGGDAITLDKPCSILAGSSVCHPHAREIVKRTISTASDILSQ